ncbi:hypothetical protein EMPS_01208 [Entomortierella parvispora]|uniref:Uncharacterized protein n=1 Tax=Entomortierella parvispora TaxID=205924 RepID=A0A9P3H2J3_9FUNG|nr:hypothetical protein EMPS_01208 [Entomortierella parvispora]
MSEAKEARAQGRRRKLKIAGLVTVAVLGSCQFFYVYGWSRFHTPATADSITIEEPPKDTVELDRACMLLDKPFIASSLPDFTKNGIRQFTDCRSVKTVAGWTVDHCSTPGSNPRNDLPAQQSTDDAPSCYPGGYFRIQRISTANAPSCSPEANKILSKDDATNKYATSFMGPDSFRVVLLGPERLSLIQQQYLGNCTYAVPYLVSRPGRFWVQKILHTYEGFDAMNEEMDKAGWPEYLGNNILDPIAERIQQEENETKQQLEHQSLERSHYHFEACSHCVSFVRMDEEQGLGGSRDHCSKSAMTQARQYGTYRARSTITSVRQAQSHDYEWIPVRPRCMFFPDQTNFEPVSESDSHERKQQKGYAADCLQKTRSLFFAGDSHVRQVFLGVMQRLQGQAGDIEDRKQQTLEAGKIKGVYDQDGFLTDTLNRIRYTIEEAGDSFDLTAGEITEAKIDHLDILETVDTVILGMGSLPASLDHWTTARFVQRVQKVFDGLAMIQQTRVRGRTDLTGDNKMNSLRVIWTGIPAWTDRADKATRDSADWRTNPRILYWNKLVDQMIDGVNRRVGGNGMIDRLHSFETTVPFKNSTMDLLHYTMSAPVSALSAELIHKLDLC